MVHFPMVILVWKSTGRPSNSTNSRPSMSSRRGLQCQPVAEEEEEEWEEDREEEEEGSREEGGEEEEEEASQDRACVRRN